MGSSSSIKKGSVFFAILVLLLVLMTSNVIAAPGISITDEGITIGSSDNPEEIASSIQLLLILTVLSLLPSILIMMTSFTRVIIVLSFLRNAMGTQQMPPNQVLIGLALFLSLFIMSPVLSDLNEQALQPYTRNEITFDQGLDRANVIMKTFMIDKGSPETLAKFASMAEIERPERLVDLPLKVVIPAFMVSELTKAFLMGFIIYIPFLVIDMVVASTLMSMGMMMLPPIMISLPFKLLLFIMVDGWNLLASTIIDSFK